MPPQDRNHAIPPSLWAVIGVFGGSALITALTAITAGVLVIPTLVVAAVLAVLAARLHQGGRVARALAALTAGTLLLLSLGIAYSAWWIVVGLATTAATGVLLLAPSVRAFFIGPFGRAPASAVSVTLVQIVACVLGALLGLGALLMLGLGVLALGSSAAAGSAASSEIGGAIGGLFGLAGGLAIGFALFYAAIAAFWLWAARALPRGSRGARIAVTVVCGLDALPSLLYLGAAPGIALTMLALLGALVGTLWLPSDARRHFGDAAPLPVVEQWHRQAITLGATIAASGAPAASPWAGTTPAPRPGPRQPFPNSGPVPTMRPAPPMSGPIPTMRPAPPRSGPVPVQHLDDPVTTPVRLGRHAQRPDRAPGSAGQPA